MFYSNTSNIQYFQKKHKIISKTQEFVTRLQNLETKLDKIEISQLENKIDPLEKLIKIMKDYMHKVLGEEVGSFPTHLSCLMKDIINSRGRVQKKENIREEIQYIKKYINTQKGIYWDETQHEDILYIYWHSKTELNIIEKIAFSVEFLEDEIVKLENVLTHKKASPQFLARCLKGG